MYEHIRFDSWENFVDTAEKKAPGDVRLASRGYRVETSWAVDMPEALQLARNGWPTGANYVKRHLDTKEAIGQHYLKVITPAQAGPGTLDMGRYIQGHPEPYLVYRDSDILADGGRIVKIVVSAGLSAGIESDALLQYGTTICEVIDTLERTGYRTELSLHHTASYSDPNPKIPEQGITWEIPLKRAEEPLDMDRVAFAIANSAVARRLVFSLMEQLPMPKRKAMSAYGIYGYGRPSFEPVDGAINFPPLSLYNQELKEAVANNKLEKWITGELEKVGVCA